MRRAAGIGVRVFIFLACLLPLTTPTLSAPVDAVKRGDYGAAYRSHPGDATLLDRWAALSISRGQTEQAEMLVRHAVDLFGWSEVRRVLFAQTQSSDPISLASGDSLRIDGERGLTLRDWYAARTAFAALIEKSPTDGEALYTLAILSAPEDPARAYALLTRAAQDPAYAKLAASAGQVLARASTDSPDTRLRQLGTALISDQQWSLAEFTLNRLIGLEQGAPGAMALTGLAQDAQGRDGWLLIEQALLAAPTDATVNYAAALHWRRVGNLDKALAALSQASLTDTRNPALAAEIAAIYRQQGNTDQAANWLELAVRLAPGEIGFHQALCALYADEKYRLDMNGLLAIKRALQAFPNDPELAALYGQIMLAMGQRDEAQIAIQRALALDDNNLRARFYLGQLLEQLGDKDGARAAYQRVASTNPASGENPFRLLAQRALEP